MFNLYAKRQYTHRKHKCNIILFEPKLIDHQITIGFKSSKSYSKLYILKISQYSNKYNFL